ncbi:Phosphotyrosyl phosphate activator (PTPA) family protein [Babesia bovis T2Bo]|uniref:Serine/threonine-protein phosphatase 2A activator n=1 Tax=Babesia bovis TaxID=5865 RepID=A7AS68_BABBO|nr:Phosphotyrosyl phosphate activator (PTPA) family protein [Babesia bovis T2Bo]EDO07387.1 Phosphotyrosyl phosphate activator (PTPA) family protein [Babesia bovis T2Bo]|eukprot:XP_001610955.1 phosphotyrosyl phosphatase activator [Babesia bovis T2Bo]
MTSPVYPSLDTSSLLKQTDVPDFVKKLNHAAMDKPIPSDSSGITNALDNMLHKITDLTNEYDPKEYKDCRYGNKGHTAWVKALEERWNYIASNLEADSMDISQENADLIRKYFLRSFGNPVRIDYGTGHEMQFILFLKVLYDCGIIKDADLSGVALNVMSSYFKLIQHLIDRYNLEPAGSKGVWGLDHFQFMPFLLGSAQLVSSTSIHPSEVIEGDYMMDHTDEYIFLQTLSYIKQKIKRVSLDIAAPMLYEICMTCSWHKINQGLMEMYINDIAHLIRIGNNC